MKSGLKRRWFSDHRNYDYLKSRHFGAVSLPDFPAEFNADSGLSGFPDQDAINYNFTPPVPAEPEGCTNYSQAELSTNYFKKLMNPADLEAVTHANANGGIDLVTSLVAAKKVYGLPSFYQIKPSGLIDGFDAIRLALYSADPEHPRTITFGTPWFPQWAVPIAGVLPTLMNFALRFVSWHDWVITGWTSKNGVPYLVGKTWQGGNYGDQGKCYLSRELCNIVINIRGVEAFVPCEATNDPIHTIDMNVVMRIVSLIRNLFHL